MKPRRIQKLERLSLLLKKVDLQRLYLQREYKYLFHDLVEAESVDLLFFPL